MTLYTATIESPVGSLTCVVDRAGVLVRIQFDDRAKDGDIGREFEEAGHRLKKSRRRTRQVRKQLEQYFAGTLKEFVLEVAPEGSEFQMEVWRELQRIPYGETRSYGEVAKAIGHERADRAVGAANAANPIPIVIPCHRVIGADGSLTGFRGGLAAKKLLLMLEARHRPHPTTGQLDLIFDE